jgi:hypothetical protein
VGGALRDVYDKDGANGGGGDSTAWLGAALADDLLDEEEVEYLRLVRPKALSRAQEASGGGGGGGSSDAFGDEDDE